MWGVYGMLVRKKRETLLKRKTISEDISSDDNIQSLRSWIRKIEQSAMSVSSRLSAVEKRLSGGMMDPEGINPVVMNGPITTLLVNRKQKNAGELARVLDGELVTLHNELVQQEQELGRLKDQFTVIEDMNTTTRGELQAVLTTLSQMNSTTELRMERLERREPFVMRLGAMEIPVEFTGIIGGLLAFLVAFLVALNQKAILLSPVFLALVGILLIGSAMFKMIRISRSTMRLCSTMPLKTSPPINSVHYQRDE